jgi:hypothetical protein
MKVFFSELWIRINSKTPAFFVKLRYFGLSLSAVGLSFQKIPNAPESLIELGVNFIVAGGVLAAISQLTVKSPDQK